MVSRTAVAGAALLACVTFTPEAKAQGKQGVGFVNFGLGPQFFLDGGSTQFMIQVQGGIELNRDLYLTFIPNFGFGNGTTIIMPLGIQYDIPIRSVPGLYVYPRFSIGAGILVNNRGGGSYGAFNITPEFGIKYVIDGKWNLGFEPFSLPILVADSPFPTTLYRLTFFGGLNF